MNRSFQTDVWYVSLTSFILSASHVCPRSIITPATVVARVNKRVWSGPFSAWCLSSWNVEAVTSERNHRQRDGNKSSDHLWCTAVLMLRRRKKPCCFFYFCVACTQRWIMHRWRQAPEVHSFSSPSFLSQKHNSLTGMLTSRGHSALDGASGDMVWQTAAVFSYNHLGMLEHW